MDLPLGRSRDVNGTLVATAEEAPREANLAFDRLYRSSRDDVYAYVAEPAARPDRRRGSHRRPPSSAPTASARASIRPAASARAWLFGIARNAALDELRRRGRQAELTAEPADLAQAGADESVEASERRLELSAALATLTPRERELIALKYFAGLANLEIAEVLGITESNAGTKLHRAIIKLREACDEAL